VRGGKTVNRFDGRHHCRRSRSVRVCALARAVVAAAEELVQALTKGLLLLLRLFLGRRRRERKLVARCRGEGIIKGLLLLLWLLESRKARGRRA